MRKWIYNELGDIPDEFIVVESTEQSSEYEEFIAPSSTDEDGDDGNVSSGLIQPLR